MSTPAQSPKRHSWVLTAKKKAARQTTPAKGNQSMFNVPSEPEKGNGSTEPNLMKTAEFEKKLRWKIQNPTKYAERWRITPKMAEAMLAWNDRNRPAAEATIKRYADMMSECRWRYTGEAIIFSTDRLIDGQHRLLACVASGVAFDALVVFGAPDEAFAFIDVGKTRTASNIFAIHGVKNHAIMAAAVQWVIGYGSGAVGSAAKGTVAPMDHGRLYDAYLAHSGLQDSAWVAHLFAPVRIVSPSMMCAIHYICAKKSRHQADEFFRKVAEGIGFAGKRDPAYKLHKALTGAAISGGHEKIGRKAAAAMTIKAWNATRLGRDTGKLDYGVDETFPKAI